MSDNLLLMLRALVAVMVMAIGMGSTPADLVELLRRPKLLIRSVVAMYLLVPLLALVLMAVHPVSIAVEVSLLVIAISAGAPLLPKKLMGLDNEAYVFSLVVTSSLLAVVTVPAWLAVLKAAFGGAAVLSSGDVARVVASTVLVPLLLGMVLRWLVPFVNDRLSDLVLRAAGVVLTLLGVVLLGMHWRFLIEAGWSFLLALGLLITGALAIGHWLGGPEDDDRTALAVACATRHLGIAVLVAASLPGPRVMVLVVAYLVVSAVVSVPYLSYRRRRSSRRLERAAA
jgi:BASS family bile acid:Na+ symporter